MPVLGRREHAQKKWKHNKFKAELATLVMPLRFFRPEWQGLNGLTSASSNDYIDISCGIDRTLVHSQHEGKT